MATDQEILDATRDAQLDLVNAPKKVTTDAGTIEEHSLADLLAMKRQAAADAAAGSPSQGLRFNRITHGGTQD